MIVLENINKKYNSKTVLKDVSLTINSDEIVGLLGVNGAGKTTLLNIIAGVIASSSGNLIIGGKDREYLEDNTIGYLPEVVPLYENMSVESYLIFVSKIKRVKNVKDELERLSTVLGLKEVLGRRIANLSKGYKQRVGICQAFIGNPKIIILDEPMSGLDPKQIATMTKLIKEQSKGRTVIFSSHIIGQVQNLCDRIILINDGRILSTDLDKESSSEKTSELVLYTRKDTQTVINKTLELKNVRECIFIKSLNSVNIYKLIIDNSLKSREEVVNHLVVNGVPILEIKEKEMTLYDKFIKLTDH